MGVTPSQLADRGCAFETRREARGRRRQGATSTPGPAWGPGPQQESAAARTSPGCRGREGGPAPRSPPGRREERPLPVSGRGLWLRRRPGRAGAQLAGREPAGAKGEGREGRTRSWVPGQADRAGCGGSRRRQPVSQSRRCPSAPRLRQREPAPRRSRSPSGGRRRRRRGGATVSTTRSPGSSCGRGGARCGTGLSLSGRLRTACGKEVWDRG